MNNHSIPEPVRRQEITAFGRTLPFETQIIERYKRRESSVEESLIEMYLAGVSVRRVEDITEALWGTRVSPSTVSELNQKVYRQIEEWRNKPIEGEHVECVTHSRTEDSEVENMQNNFEID